MVVLTFAVSACASSHGNPNITSNVTGATQTTTPSSVSCIDNSATSISDPNNVMIFPNQSIEVLLTVNGYMVVPTILRAFGGEPQRAPGEGYSWRVPEGSGIPDGIAVDASGLVTYTGSKAVSPGSFTVIATDGSHTATATVSVSVADLGEARCPGSV